MFGSGKTCIGGLPGAGSVGKVAADCLCTALECTHLRSFFSSGFPAQVMVGDGVAQLLHAELQLPKSQDNLLVLTGDAQPKETQDMYSLAGEILEAAKSMGADEIVALAACVGDRSEKVVGVSSDKDGIKDLEKAGIPVFRNGAIGGINGLLAGMAPFYGLRGYCLLGTTSGDDLIDLRAISNLLDAIKKVLDLDLPLQVLPATEEHGKPSSFEEMDMNYR